MGDGLSPLPSPSRSRGGHCDYCGNADTEELRTCHCGMIVCPDCYEESLHKCTAVRR